MNRKSAEMLLEAADSMALDAEIYEDYSGRGMFGKTTTGFVTAPSDLLGIIAMAGFLAAEEGDEEASEQFLVDMAGAHQDNMGRDQVILY